QRPAPAGRPSAPVDPRFRASRGLRPAGVVRQPAARGATGARQRATHPRHQTRSCRTRLRRDRGERRPRPQSHAQPEGGAMRGHVRRRGRTWSIVYDEGRDEHGVRMQRWKGGFRTETEAESALTKVLASLDDGSYVQPSKLTVRDYLELEWLP